MLKINYKYIGVLCLKVILSKEKTLSETDTNSLIRRKKANISFQSFVHVSTLIFVAAFNFKMLSYYAVKLTVNVCLG
jgi:hypothetical protein